MATRAIDTFSIKVQRDNETHSAKIMLYDTLEDLRADGNEYDKKRGGDGVSNDNVGGLTHSFWIVRYDKDGKMDGLKSQTNIVRMLKTVGMGVASHELAHVACHMFRVFLADENGELGDMNLGGGTDDGETDYMAHEESFAYIVSDLTYDLCTKMFKRGHWK